MKRRACDWRECCSKGSSLGTITDVEGAYVLANVPERSEVVISFIGYQAQTLSASNKALAKIILKEDNEMLDEVVVVGYGTIKKQIFPVQ